MFKLIVFCVLLTVVQCTPFKRNIFSPRIVNGNTAQPGQYPYQVSIRSAANRHFCGGSILNTLWILTAAHCTFGQSIDDTIVVVGAHHIQNDGGRFGVAQIINHASYNDDTLENDISMVRLSIPLIYNSFIQPIQISRTLAGGNVAAIVSGWGATSNGGPAPDYLQYLAKTTITNAECKVAFVPLNYDSYVFDTVLCTKALSNQGFCSGDSGGPLAIRNANGNDEIIGVVSWAINCAYGYPDAYTRVSTFVNWIEAITGPL